MIGEHLKGSPRAELQPYLDGYPGMQELMDELSTEALRLGVVEAAGGDDLRRDVFLTRFDGAIKAFCASSG